MVICERRAINVVARDNEFDAAWGAARDGQAKLVAAYDEYAKTGLRLPTGPETVPRGEGVEVLGRSLRSQRQ